MRASDMFKPPQLSLKQRSHHCEFWVPLLEGGQKSRSRHTFLVKKKKKTLADEATSSLKHTIASTMHCCSRLWQVWYIFQGSGIKTVKEQAAQGRIQQSVNKNYSAYNSAWARGKTIKVQSRHHHEQHEQQQQQQNLGCGCSSPAKIMANISSTKDTGWSTKDKHLLFCPTTDFKAGPPWFEFLVNFDFFAPW